MPWSILILSSYTETERHRTLRTNSNRSHEQMMKIESSRLQKGLTVPGLSQTLCGGMREISMITAELIQQYAK